eukprot:scaffold17757_cov62-Phaeocystis_antarctica.AAC.2
MVLRPSALSTTSATPSRTTAIDEDVVPRSMPTAAPTGSCCSLGAAVGTCTRVTESRTFVGEARAAAGCERPARGGWRKEARVTSATQLPSIPPRLGAVRDGGALSWRDVPGLYGTLAKCRTLIEISYSQS